MSTEDYEFRLSTTQDPAGQISLTELGQLAERLQELATRIARWVAEIHGPGRSPALLAEIAHLRLSGLTEGSTRLRISRGSPGTLDVEDDVERDLSQRFWDVIAGISTDAPPQDAPEGVRESAAGVLDALARAGSDVTVTRIRDHAQAQFRPAERNRAVWVPERRVAAEQMTVRGRLEMVDLHSGTFRVRDDVGNAITLYRVREPHAAAKLVDRQATAAGARLGARRGPALDEVTVVPAEPLPPEWSPSFDDESWRAQLSGPGPDPSGGVDVDDDDWAVFMRALQEQ